MNNNDRKSTGQPPQKFHGLEDENNSKPLQVLFACSTESYGQQFLKYACNLPTLDKYTIFPKKGICENIYFHQTPSLQLFQQQQSQHILQSGLYGGQQQINRIFIVLKIKCFTQNDVCKIEIENKQQVANLIKLNKYEKCVSLLLTYKCDEEEVVTSYFSRIQKIQIDKLELPYILLNLSKLDRQATYQILKKMYSEHQSSNPIQISQEIKWDQQKEVQISQKIELIMQNYQNNLLQQKSILDLEQIIVFLKNGMFQDLAEHFQFNQQETYRLLLHCKVKYYMKIKEKIQFIINQILIKIDDIKTDHIKQCRICNKLVLITEKTCHQMRIFDYEDPPFIIKFQKDNFHLTSLNSTSIKCDNTLDSLNSSQQKIQTNYCQGVADFVVPNENEIEIKKKNYIERIKSHSLEIFDFGQEIFSQEPIEEQKQNVIQQMPDPINRQYQVLLIGSQQSSNQFIFSKMCNEENNNNYTIFPMQSIYGKIYFHLSPNIKLDKISDIIDIVDSLNQVQDIDAILICIDPTINSNSVAQLRELKIYNQNIVFILTQPFNYQKSNDYTSLIEPYPSIILTESNFEPETFQQSLINILIKFSRLQKTSYQIRQDKYQQLQQVNNTINLVRQYLEGEQLINKSFQYLEDLLYYLSFKFIKDIHQSLPFYEKQQYIDKFITGQQIRYYYSSIIYKLCEKIFERIQEKLKQFSTLNVRQCQHCNNLIVKSSVVGIYSQIICSENRISLQTGTRRLTLKQDQYHNKCSIVFSDQYYNYNKDTNKYYQCRNKQWNSCIQIAQQMLNDFKSKYIQKITNVEQTLLQTFNNKYQSYTSRFQSVQSYEYEQTQIQKQQLTHQQNYIGKQEKTPSYINQEQQEIILIGQCGVGKTKVYNKLCNNEQRIQHTLNSQTKKFSKQCINNLTIYDTPSFDVRDEEGASNFKVIDQFAEFFQSIKVNQIFILVSYQRIGTMKKMIDDCYNPLRKFKNMITFIITNMDQYLQDFEKIQELKDKLEQYYGKQNKVVTQGNMISSLELQKQIRQILINTKQQTLDLSETIFDVKAQSQSGQKFVQGLNQINQQLIIKNIQEEQDKIQQMHKQDQQLMFQLFLIFSFIL